MDVKSSLCSDSDCFWQKVSFPNNNSSHLKLSESVQIFLINDHVGKRDLPDTFPENVTRNCRKTRQKHTHTHTPVTSLSKPLANCSVCLVAEILLPLIRKCGFDPRERCKIESVVWCLDDKYLAIGKNSMFLCLLSTNTCKSFPFRQHVSTI